jgi:hypothetical protein
MSGGPVEESLCRLGILPTSQEKLQHCARVVDGTPEPEFFAPHLDANLVAVSQFFSEEGCELDVPLAQGFMADLNSAFLEQFSDMTLAEGGVVREPESLLNDAQRKPVSVGFAISYEGSV